MARPPERTERRGKEYSGLAVGPVPDAGRVEKGAAGWPVRNSQDSAETDASA